MKEVWVWISDETLVLVSDILLEINLRQGIENLNLYILQNHAKKHAQVDLRPHSVKVSRVILNNLHWLCVARLFKESSFFFKRFAARQTARTHFLK